MTRAMLLQQIDAVQFAMWELHLYAGIQYIGEQMSAYLSGEDYAGAFNVYAEKCDELITLARNGTPYGLEQDTAASGEEAEEADEPLSLVWIPISIAIGVVVAIIVVKGMKSNLKCSCYGIRSGFAVMSAKT